MHDFYMIYIGACKTEHRLYMVHNHKKIKLRNKMLPVTQIFRKILVTFDLNFIKKEKIIFLSREHNDTELIVLELK